MAGKHVRVNQSTAGHHPHVLRWRECCSLARAVAGELRCSSGGLTRGYADVQRGPPRGNDSVALHDPFRPFCGMACGAPTGIAPGQAILTQGICEQGQLEKSLPLFSNQRCVEGRCVPNSERDTELLATDVMPSHGEGT